jgi:argininosuccinate lyase/amino-acid N-acetyltransferase
LIEVFNADKMEKTLDAGYATATNLLDYLISKGVAFRTGHHLVGQIVLAAINAQQPLAQFPLSEFKKHSNLIEADVYEWFEVGRNKANLSLKMREIVGGTGPKTVAAAVAQAKKRVKNID